MRQANHRVNSALLPLLWATAVATSGCAAEIDPAREADAKMSLSAGLPVPDGNLEAVVAISSGWGFCTGTLVTPQAVLTAAHCMCESASNADNCSAQARVSFRRARRVDNPATSADESAERGNWVMRGDVVIHPDYGVGGRLSNDYALVVLDRPAREFVQVRPMRMEPVDLEPRVGDPVALVGTGARGASCDDNSPAFVKEFGYTEVDAVDWPQIETLDPLHLCGGDSGGPLLSLRLRVLGIAYATSRADAHRSRFWATAPILDWISAEGCGDFDATSPDPDQCSELCPCGVEEGDCDTDSECAGDLRCVHNVGNQYGLPPSYDVCREPCPSFDPQNPDPSFCNDPTCPCGLGEGDCDRDDQCAGNLVCGRNNGADFGLPGSWEVCIRPGAACGNGQPDPFEACDDGNLRAGDGCSAQCTVEAGWACPRFNFCYETVPSCFPRCGYEPRR